MKNPCGKQRAIEHPYEIWQTPDQRWTWLVLKKYQTPERESSNPFARWFCLVKSPFVPDGELCDVYVRDIKRHAVCVYQDLETRPVAV